MTDTIPLILTSPTRGEGTFEIISKSHAALPDLWEGPWPLPRLSFGSRESLRHGTEGAWVFNFGELRRWDRARNLYLAGYSSSRSQFMM